MVEKIKYRIIEKRIFPKFERLLIDYYSRYFPEESNKITIHNSSVFFVAFKENKPIGVCRLLTDFSRFALLLDLIVRKTERNKGIGKTLVKMVDAYTRKKQIKHLVLTTDPRYDWLTDFYRKLGFELVTNKSLMEYKD